MEKDNTNNCNCGGSVSKTAVSLSVYDKTKLGKCKKCMLIAIIGTLAGWLMYFIAFTEPNMPTLYKYFVLIIPVPFSCFLIVHSVFRAVNKSARH